MFAGAIAFYVSYALGAGHFALSFVALIVAGAAMYAPYGPFFALIHELVPANVAGSATAFVNGAGALGGFAGSYLVGYLNARTGTPGRVVLADGARPARGRHPHARGARSTGGGRRRNGASDVNATKPAVTPLHPLFAAEIAGVDLRTVDEPAMLASLRALLDRYAVVVFRDQPFTDEEQIAFARRFDGELVTKVGKSVVEGKRRLGHDALADISNLDENGAILETDDRRRMYALGNRLWHTDASFQQPSARYSMLSARAVPERGGHTEWADMRAAYDALPAELKAQIAELRAFHSLLHSRASIGFTDFSDAERAQFPGAEQPLVRTHPTSGRRSLYLASHAAHVVGMPVPDGRILLRELIVLATLPQFVYRHQWRANDFVIWDNRCTMHRGVPFDDASQRRDLRRVSTVDLPRT